jgi:hypothetical protein
MPYKIEKRDSKYVVVKEDDGKVMGTHESYEKARAQQKALYAGEKTGKAASRMKK